MKKSVKITISVVVGVILITSLALNVFLAMECGYIEKPKSLSGSINEEWRVTDTRISEYYPDENKYYSNNGDFIYHVFMEHPNDDGYYFITYDQKFSITNDLDVCFKIQQTDGTEFYTYVERSHSDGTEECIKFYSDDKSPKIVQVWVRTID